MGKTMKRIMAVVLSALLLVSLIPATAISADAAVKRVEVTKKITVTEGMKQTLSVKNISRKKITWKSSDKDVAAVSKNGVVVGVSDGKATIKGTYKRDGKKYTVRTKVTVKTPYIERTEITVVSGSSITVSVKDKYKNSKYEWSSSDEDIASVDDNGVITGVNIGKSKISVKIKIPKNGLRRAKTITRSLSVDVVNSCTVSSQQELEAALKAGYGSISVKTDDKTNISVPEGDFRDTSLIIDAPNADIVNHGDFREITINRIAADTYTEMGNENILILRAATGHIKVPADITVKTISVNNPIGASYVEVDGAVQSITVESASSIRFTAKGSIDNVSVNSKTTLTVDGSSTKSINLTIAKIADGTALISSVPVSVTSDANINITLSKGAETSSITITDADKKVDVVNNTSSTIPVTDSKGNIFTLTSGSNSTVSGTNTPASTPTTGSTTNNSNSNNDGYINYSGTSNGNTSTNISDNSDTNKSDDKNKTDDNPNTSGVVATGSSINIRDKSPQKVYSNTKETELLIQYQGGFYEIDRSKIKLSDFSLSKTPQDSTEYSSAFSLNSIDIKQDHDQWTFIIIGVEKKDPDAKLIYNHIVYNGEYLEKFDQQINIMSSYYLKAGLKLSAYQSEDGKYLTLYLPVSFPRSELNPFTMVEYLDDKENKLTTNSNGTTVMRDHGSGDLCFFVVKLYPKEKTNNITINIPSGKRLVNIDGEPVSGVDKIPVQTAKPIEFGSTAVYDAADNALYVDLTGNSADIQYPNVYNSVDTGHFEINDGIKDINLSKDYDSSKILKRDNKWCLEIKSAKFADSNLSKANEITLSYNPDTSPFGNLTDASGKPIDQATKIIQMSDLDKSDDDSSLTEN